MTTFKNFDIEFKASEEEKGVIEGYAAAYGNVDRQGDILEAGAFKSAKGKRIPIFGMHNPREGIGTGTVTEDEKGLKIKIKLAIDNQDSEVLATRAKEYYAMSKEGIIQKMSVGFLTEEKEYETHKAKDGKERYIRRIKKADLVEVSLVPVPANPNASITTVKEMQDDLDEKKGDQEFISACMKRLKNRYPDQDQRLAVCFSELRRGKGEEGDDDDDKALQDIIEKATKPLEDRIKELENKLNNQKEPEKKTSTFDALIAQRLGLF